MLYKKSKPLLRSQFSHKFFVLTNLVPNIVEIYLCSPSGQFWLEITDVDADRPTYMRWRGQIFLELLLFIIFFSFLNCGWRGSPK